MMSSTTGRALACLGLAAAASVASAVAPASAAFILVVVSMAIFGIWTLGD